MDYGLTFIIYVQNFMNLIGKSLELEMSSYEVSIKEARQKFVAGLLEESINAYRTSLERLADLIRTTSTVVLRNKYVEVYFIKLRFLKH